MHVDAANRKIQDPIDYLIGASKKIQVVCMLLALGEYSELLKDANQLQAKITEVLDNTPIEEWETVAASGGVKAK